LFIAQPLKKHILKGFPNQAVYHLMVWIHINIAAMAAVTIFSGMSHWEIQAGIIYKMEMFFKYFVKINKTRYEVNTKG